MCGCVHVFEVQIRVCEGVHVCEMFACEMSACVWGVSV